MLLGVTRRKTTVYLDPDVLTATKVLAATREQSESRIVEDALRAYLRSEDAAAARDDLRELMERVRTRSELTDEEAMAVAVEEVRAVRSTRRSNRRA